MAFFGIPLGFAGVYVVGGISAYVFWGMVQVYVAVVSGLCIISLPLVARDWARKPL